MKRIISINNSLCTGICNYNCRLCGVNKPTYHGIKKFQDEYITKSLINKILNDAEKGIEFRIITNSGSGEPTLHPEFRNRMELFGDMLRNWPSKESIPEVSIVTNASNLLKESVIQALIENPITVNISFPIYDEEIYINHTFSDGIYDKNIFQTVVEGIDLILKYNAIQKISKVCFHISPPIPNMTSEDLEKTISFLCKRASLVGLSQVNIIVFPNISNRSGLVHGELINNDYFYDFYSFNGNIYHNVKVVMENVWYRFYRSKKELEVIHNEFIYPCIWNASNIFITAEGYSVCCNDQENLCKLGTILEESVFELYKNKTNFVGGEACIRCNQQFAVRLTVEQIMNKIKLEFI